MTDTAIDSRPVCWMDRLPDELKVKIVRLCAEQDKRWNVWAERGSLDYDHEDGDRRNVAFHGIQDYMERVPENIVGALMQVSRVWYRIAAPIPFEASLAVLSTIAALDMVADPCRPCQQTLRTGNPDLISSANRLYDHRFRMLVFPRHRQHFTTLEIYNRSLSELGILAERLDDLANIRHVLFDLPGEAPMGWSPPPAPRMIAPAVYAAPPEEIDSSDRFAHDCVRAALATLLCRAETLDLRTRSNEPNLHLLLNGELLDTPRFQATRLRIECRHLNNPSIFYTLGTRMPNLERLEIACDRFGGREGPAPGTEKWPALTHFTLRCREAWPEPALRVCEASSASLRSIRLEVCQPMPFTAATYPCLQNLYLHLSEYFYDELTEQDIQEEKDALLAFYESMTPSRFPALKSLTLVLDRKQYTVPLPDILRELVARPGVAFTFTEIPIETTPLLGYIRPVVPDPEPAIPLTEYDYATRTKTDEAELQEGGTLLHEIDRAIDFLVEWRRRAGIHKDTVELAYLAQALQGVEVARTHREE
ncbi:hypothetical protein JCM10908_002225 [Rhodotorula pacifica]|uniref:uncharacterized protein n=1 Tax=Rhodotorula pacifica TaxID=1495444 RepID=UPI00318004A0